MLFSILFTHVFCEFTPTDPFFSQQFPLENNGRWVGISNEDIQIHECWNSDNFGAGVAVAVIDDGCNYKHVDLNRSYVAEKSFNYKTWTTDAMYDDESDTSGTTNAGNIAADGNDVAIIGVAKDSKVGCFNIKNNLTTANIIDAIQRNNDFYKIKLLGFYKSCGKSCDFDEPNTEIHETIQKSNENMIYVKPAGYDAILGGDTNYDVISRSPRVIVVSDSNHRGARSAWSNRGTNIFCTAPVGGSSSFDNIRVPTFPSLSNTNITGVQENDPRNKGASFVSGAIAVLLGAFPSLTWREVQYLIAASSTKIDPNHPSWVINGGRFSYSHIYGFGRLNSFLMMQIAGTMDKLPEQVSSSVENNDAGDIPVLRGGSMTRKVTFTEENFVGTIEYVTLKIEMETTDFSAVRILVWSPSRTFSYIKSPSRITEKNGKKTYEFLVRTFYGESSKGEWTIKFISDSNLLPPKFYSLNLTAYGCKQSYIFRNYQRDGSDPYAAFAAEMTPNITITSALGKPIQKIACGVPFNINVTYPESDAHKLTFTLGDALKTSRWPILDRAIEADSVKQLTIPCHFKNFSRMNLSVENFEARIYGSKSIVIENTENFTNEVVNPQTYDIIRIDPAGYIDFDLEFRMSLHYWIDGAYAQRARLQFYDIDNDAIVHTKYLDLINASTVRIENATRCYRCLMSIVPSWYSNMTDECLNIIQPVSILKPLEVPPEPFIIPLSNACPIPRSIKTPTPPPATPFPSASPWPIATRSPSATLPGEGAKQNKAAVIGGLSFLIVFGIALGVFLWINRRRHESSPSVVSSREKITDFSLIE